MTSVAFFLISLFRFPEAYRPAWFAIVHTFTGLLFFICWILDMGDSRLEVEGCCGSSIRNLGQPMSVDKTGIRLTCYNLI